MMTLEVEFNKGLPAGLGFTDEAFDNKPLLNQLAHEGSVSKPSEMSLRRIMGVPAVSEQ